MAYAYSSSTQGVRSAYTHRGYVYYTTSSTATTFTVTMSKVGEYMHSSNGSYSGVYYKGTSTVSGSLTSLSSTIKASNSATRKMTSTTNYYNFGGTAVSKTYTRGSSNSTATLTVTWKWSGDTYTGTTSITIPKATYYTATVVSANTAMGTVTGGGSYVAGSTITIKATPKAGYRFVKWTYSDGWSGSNTNATVSWTAASSGKATASFEPYSLHVKFNVNGGSIPDNPHVYNGNETPYYWKVTDSLIYLSTTNATSFTAYNKKLEASITDWDCYNDTSFGLSRTGYTLKSKQEWNLKADGTGTSFNQDTGNGYPWTTKRLNGGTEITNDNVNVVVYANWVPKTTTVTFNPQGGTLNGAANWGSDANTTNTHSHTMTYNSSAGQGMGVASKTGYTFGGWCTNTAGTGNIVYGTNGYCTTAGNYWSAAGGSGNPNGAVWKSTASTLPLYAKWTVNSYPVTVESNGNGTVGGGGTYNYGSTVTLTATPATGYHFVNWTFTGAKTGTSTSHTFTMPAGAVTATATFALNQRTISFNANGGTGSFASTTQNYGSQKVLPTMAQTGAITRSGYSFYGWNSNQTNANAGTREYTNGGTVASWTGSHGATLTLYAVWVPNYTVTYNANGRGAAPASQTLAYPTATNAQPNITGVTGWSCNGWNTQANGSGTAYAAGQLIKAANVVPTGNITLYAQWQQGVYTLNVDPNGGIWNGSDQVQSFVQTLNTTLAIPAPTKAGAVFLGWAEVGPGHLGKIVSGNPRAIQVDPSFDTTVGGVAIYNNKADGTVTHTVQSSTAGYGSREIKITTTSTTATPGSGGYYINTIASPNAKFVHTMVAKLPVGYTLMNAQNGTGNERTIKWLTPQVGTGKWEVYSYEHHCGSTGTFSTFGHVYVPEETVPVTWYLAYSAINDISDGWDDVYTFGEGTETLKALWAPKAWTQVSNTWKPVKEMWVNIDNDWKRVSDVWGEISTNEIGWHKIGERSIPAGTLVTWSRIPDENNWISNKIDDNGWVYFKKVGFATTGTTGNTLQIQNWANLALSSSEVNKIKDGPWPCFINKDSTPTASYQLTIVEIDAQILGMQIRLI